MTSLRFVPAGLAIVAATYGLARYAYGLFLPDIQNDLGLSHELLGLIAGGSYAGYLLATLVGSSISAIVGPRLPVVLGGVAASFGMFLIGFAGDNAWWLAFGVILAGTSPGLAYPPLSDAVVRMIRPERQNRVYAVINSGTSLGVIVAGPIALWAGAEWRSAWLAFALFALVATLWNAWLLPSGRHGGKDVKLPRLHWRWFINRRSRRLFITATAFGLVSSVYWTFSVDLLTRYGDLPEFYTRAFWVVIGVAGLAGGVAGDLVSRCGLRSVFRRSVLASSLAVVAIAVAPSTLWVVFSSAILFGGTFILVTGLFGIWSIHVFRDRPSAGFGATFFLISAGQLVGPVVAGFFAGGLGLAEAFYLSAALGLIVAYLGPVADFRSMTTSARSESSQGSFAS